MKHMNKLLFFVLIITLTSCVGNNSREKSTVQDEIKSKIGKKLDLPFIPDNNQKYRLKIATFVNGDCPSCVDDLSLWEDFFPKIKNKDSLLFVVYLFSSDIGFLKKYCKLLSNPLVTIVEDKGKIFYKNNSLSGNKLLHTFITNKSNKILLVGNPVFSKKLEDLYLKLINNTIGY